jgi:hypothetical protein
MVPSLFDEEYKKLNKAQREAVDSINGPVMVGQYGEGLKIAMLQ